MYAPAVISDVQRTEQQGHEDKDSGDDQQQHHHERFVVDKPGTDQRSRPPRQAGSMPSATLGSLPPMSKPEQINS